jgi:hypothetical protein
VFGSSQGSALGSHCHDLTVVSGGAGRPEWLFPNTACPLGATYPSPQPGGGAVRTAGFTSTVGSTETRPMNVAMLPCIKWQVTTAPSSCGIPCACITAKGTIITGDAPNNPVAIPVGTDGQALVACAACPTGLTWTTPAATVTAATPTVAGTVLGCTVATYTAIGCNALLVNTGPGNVAVGVCALASNTTADGNTAVGDCALRLNSTGVNNVAVGSLSLSSSTTGGFNVAIGRNALIANTTGCFNTVSGYNAGCLMTTGSYNVGAGYQTFGSATAGDYNVAVGTLAHGLLTTGTRNVAIGPNVNVTSPTGDCQLAIGFANACNWLTGDSSKNIQPGAGIKDCAGLTGTSCQVLASTATGVQWRNASELTVGINAVASFTVTAGTIGNAAGLLPVVPGVNGVTIVAENNPLSWLNPANGRITPTIAGYYQVDVVVTSQGSSRNTWGGFMKNGVTVGQSISTISGSTGDWNSAVYSSIVAMNGINDYIEMGAGYQGSTVSFAPATGINRISVSLVGANVAITNPVPIWTSAGTIQSVGIGATITAPTITTTTYNNVRYRQLGPKEWEVQAVFKPVNGGTTAGNGYYLLTLPNGLQFDITSPYQLPYQNVPDDNQSWLFYGLTNSYARASQNGATSYQQSTIVPWDATRYRIMFVGPNTDFWRNGYYTIGNTNQAFKWGFTFQTP